jgi:hypothetical protein
MDPETRPSKLTARCCPSGPYCCAPVRLPGAGCEGAPRLEIGSIAGFSPATADRGDRARTCDLRFWRPPPLESGKGIARSSRSQSAPDGSQDWRRSARAFKKPPAKFLIRTESHRVTRAAAGGTDDASRSGCRAAARSSSASHARANRAVAPAVRRCDLHARISIGRDACDLQPLMQRTYLLRDAARRPGNSPSSSATRAQSARRARADAGRLRPCGVPAQVASAGLNRLNVIVPPHFYRWRSFTGRLISCGMRW